MYGVTGKRERWKSCYRNPRQNFPAIQLNFEICNIQNSMILSVILSIAKKIRVLKSFY